MRQTLKTVCLLAAAYLAGGTGFCAEAGKSEFGNAAWVFPKTLAAATNTTVEFRTPFTAPNGGAARLALAADTVCAVFLNGEPVVETLRFPDVPPARFYDVLDISPVKKG